jgi:hypothetical protein
MDPEEVVVPYIETLTGADVEFGKRLWDALRENRDFPTAGMFWLFEPGASEWHLMVASPLVDKLGPRDAYRVLSQVSRDVPADSAQLLKIELISPRQALYEALRKVFAKTKSVEGARLGGSQVQGMYVEDAYLYGVR